MLPEDLPQDFMEFNARFGTDEQCRECLAQARWPDGFRCEGRGHGDACTLRTRMAHECAACRKQFTVTVGTIFEDSHIPIGKWLMGIFILFSSATRR